MKNNQERESYSWSKILTMAECPYKYKLRYVDRIIPKEKSLALAAGYAMSRGLEAFRRMGTKDEAFKGFMDGWEKDGRILLLSKEEDPHRSVERCLEILGAYTERYPDEPERIIRTKSTDAIELEFEYELSEVNALFIGRIDGIISEESGIAIIEDKTTSRLGESYFRTLKDSCQILWYLCVASSLGLFNIEDKPQMPRCLINAIYMHPKNLRFERDIALKSTQSLVHARENLVEWIKYARKVLEAGIFPQNSVDNSMCTKYGGCDYLPLKNVSGSMRERILANEYIIKPKRRKD